MSDTGRTLPPTRRKIRKAREKGQVPRSRDLLAFVGWSSVAIAIVATFPGARRAMHALSIEVFSTAPSQSAIDVAGLIEASAVTLLSLSAVPAVACLGAVVIASLVFTGPVQSVRSVTPKLENLAPIAGLKRIFSAQRWVDSLRDVVKLTVLLVLGAAALEGVLAPVLGAVGQDPVHGTALLRHVLVQLALFIGVGAAALALVDAAWSRHRWLAQLKMTPAELKQEIRQTEGDPSLKGQRRRLHREISEHGLLEEVRRASVVIVNPTHVAVALRWDEQQMDAPTVTASGREQMARRIIAAAREAGVPVVHEPALARTLADLSTGEMIPEELYEAVAAVINVIGVDETGSPGDGASHHRGTLDDRDQRR